MNKSLFKFSLLPFPIILVITFLVGFFILNHFNQKNQALLEHTNEIHIPNIEISLQLQNDLSDIQHLLQSAVATKDDMLFVITDSIASDFSDKSASINNDNNLINYSDSILNQFSSYYKNARYVSEYLINNEMDTNIQDDVFKMLEGYNNLNSTISVFRDETKIMYAEHNITIEENNHSAKVFNMIIIIVAFIVSIIIVYFVSKKVSDYFRLLNSELEKANISLIEKNSLLEESEQKLKESIATKDKFFSIIAHDLRGPLGGSMQLAELMKESIDEFSKEEIAEYSNALFKSINKVFNLLENLLQWSRVQRDLVPYNPFKYNLLEFTTRSVEPLTDNARQKKISLEINIDSGLEVWVDENMTDAIFRNITSNAIKFTPENGTIIINAKPEDDLIKISIKDSGIGMPENIRNNLFDITVNTGRPGTNGESSSGLGLIICKEFVEKQGGEINIESEEGKGSTFVFTLPATADK
jgi:signal transduction histidine kinase